MPSISIILPVYNAVSTIERACQSLLAQRLSDIELIAIDDGSDDGTTECLNALAAADDRVSVHTVAHEGLVNALHLGLERAAAPYIARMDADDVSHPDRLALQKAFLDSRPEVGLVSCGVEYAGCRTTQRGYAAYVDWINTLRTHEEIALYRFVESPIAHPTVMYRRELVSEHGGYRDGLFPEDYELWLRWLEAGVRMEKLPDKLLEWSDSPNRLSRLDKRYSPDAFYTLKARYLAAWLEANNPQHPDVVIWGAGRQSRLRAERLEEHGVRITAYIDIDPNKVGQTVAGRPVWPADNLPEPGEHFILPYVGSRGARALIEEALQARGYLPRSHYVCGA